MITVESRKYDGRVSRTWRVGLKRRAGTLVVVEGVFETEVRHPLLGHIVEGTLSTEFFWTDRWYSVFRFREPSGALRNFYCNLNTPPAVEPGRITFVDLDIDVLVAPDFSYRVLDEDEFELHAARYKYPPEFRTRAEEALAELLDLIARRQFPFSDEAL
jgi:uncharacterized protein